MARTRLSDEQWETRANLFTDTSRHPQALWRAACIVCAEDLDRGRVLFRPAGCLHVFHGTCAREWGWKGTATCPLCRAPYFLGGKEHQSREDK